MDSLTARFRAVDLVHLAMLGLLVAASLWIWNDTVHATWLLGLNAVLFAAVAGLAAGPFARLDPSKAALARLAVSYFLVAALFNELVPFCIIPCSRISSPPDTSASMSCPSPSSRCCTGGAWSSPLPPPTRP
jgi:hypothetical protein